MPNERSPKRRMLLCHTAQLSRYSAALMEHGSKLHKTTDACTYKASAQVVEVQSAGNSSHCGTMSVEVY